MRQIFIYCFFYLLLFSTFYGFSQDCNCVDQFNWMKTTFEENDAGFQYVIDNKGKSAYEAHNKEIASKVQAVNGLNECATILNQWLQFFRAGHIGITISNQNNNNSQQDNSEETIRTRFKDWEQHKVNIKEFKEYVSKLKTPGFEGIWTSTIYTIGVIKEGDGYVGFIIEADGVYWSEKQVKFKLESKGNSDYKAEFYVKDHSAVFWDKAELVGNNYMKIGNILLKRKDSVFESIPEVENYFEMIGGFDPSFKELSNNSVLLRIPSFQISFKKKIDSLLKVHHDKIINAENFIIDIRNNGGGSDAAYRNMIPYLYTNPIREVGVEFLSTPLNNARMDKIINNPEYPEDTKEWARNGLEKLNNNPNKFVKLGDEEIEIQTEEQVYANPKNVAIIINKNNGSTSEQFLLAAKQSKKVKLFGVTTVGALDISNMNFVEFPCGNMQLGYCLSKSLRIPGMAIDGKGIQPDYYIDKSIPDYKWINFVQAILEN